MPSFLKFLEDTAQSAVDAAQSVAPVVQAASTAAQSPMGAINAALNVAQQANQRTNLPVVQPAVNAVTAPARFGQAAQQAAGNVMAPSAIAAMLQGDFSQVGQIPRGAANIAGNTAGYLSNAVNQIPEYVREDYPQQLAGAMVNFRNNPGVGTGLGALLATADPYVQIANAPVEAVHESQGEGVYRYVTTGQARPEDVAQPFNLILKWAQEHPQEAENIRTAYEQGYNGFKGGRAVWEYYIGKQNTATKVAAEVVNDPWNALLGAGAVEAGAVRGLSLIHI